MTSIPPTTDSEVGAPEMPPRPCVMCFNAHDPSGAAGLAADISALASAGCHPVPVCTSIALGDTRGLLELTALDAELVEDQARRVLEDLPVQAFVIGLLANPGQVEAVASVLSDYPGIPVVLHMADRHWEEHQTIEFVLDACSEMLLPLTTVLVGRGDSLTRWLLPDWPQGVAGARQLAAAVEHYGTPYVLATDLHLGKEGVDNHLACAESLLTTAQFPPAEAAFSGAGDTLASALAGLLAQGQELPQAAAEALTYLDQSQLASFRPGMGHRVPDRFFWATPEPAEDEAAEPAPTEAEPPSP